ncbi:MAG: ImmA/IrrE family metallo-endopeptidase [Chlorobi bacterium]|nr:MAG: hypothetical protein UZ07_CHB004000307 [Chlorobi bacterium OLB7]MBK8909954.1 ImmA/IrrE family metallo-endopeptidase [Chlorobiota bacterium]
MTPPVAASIPVLLWAARRAGLHDNALSARFRKWPLWISGQARPTLRQLETFADLTHTPIGYFFLPEPPVIELPVPDFRTLRDEALSDPSSNLLETIYLCQQRQDWYRDYMRLHGLPALDFIGSAHLQQAPETVAQRIRETLESSAAQAPLQPSTKEALRQLIARVEDAGIMVMVNSVVGNNTHRNLDVREFRGFALADPLAPLIFLNGADSKAAQMFTLAHELAHLWLNAPGVSNPQADSIPEQPTEQWCNQVAAEFLMPLRDLRAMYQPKTPIPQEIQRLARAFKVSTLVALRRLFDAGFINQTTLWEHYRQEVNRLQNLEQTNKSGGGGDFYHTMNTRASKRFVHAVVSSTLEGQTLFQDAFRMLGLRTTATFYQAARELGVIP